MKTINLTFSKSMIALAGNPFGRNTFREQVVPHLEGEDKFCIVFPNQIEMIASSFVQGFFAHWLQEYGVEGVFQHVQVMAKDDDVVRRICENLI